MLRSFGQADGLIGMSIDERVQNEAVQFVKNNQNADGSFPSICSPIQKEMQGCSGGICSLTAYVTLALLEAGISPTVNKKLRNNESEFNILFHIGREYRVGSALSIKKMCIPEL